jgi:hypothetical protein
LQWLQNREQFRLSGDQAARFEQLVAQMTCEQFDAWLRTGETLCSPFNSDPRSP